MWNPNVQAHDQRDNLDTPLILVRIGFAPCIFRFRQDSIIHVEQWLSLRRPVWVKRDLADSVGWVRGVLSGRRLVI